LQLRVDQPVLLLQEVLAPHPFMFFCLCRMRATDITTILNVLARLKHPQPQAIKAILLYFQVRWYAFLHCSCLQAPFFFVKFKHVHQLMQVCFFFAGTLPLAVISPCSERPRAHVPS